MYTPLRLNYRTGGTLSLNAYPPSLFRLSEISFLDYQRQRFLDRNILFSSNDKSDKLLGFAYPRN